MYIAHPFKPSSDNSVSMLVSSHHEVSSQWKLYVRGILNKGEQTGIGVLEVLMLVLPDCGAAKTLQFAFQVLEQR